MAKKALDELELLPTEKAVEIEIEGRAPGLLMHNPESMLSPKGKGRGGIKQCAHGIALDKPCKDCLELRTYRTRSGSGELCIRDKHIFTCLVHAAKAFHVESGRGRKASAAAQIGGTVRVYPADISLGMKDYDAVYSDWVVIVKQRVISHRPWIKNWKAKFYLIYDTRFWGDDAMLHDILQDAGIRKGILDYRPEHLGSFGTFKVTKWQVL